MSLRGSAHSLGSTTQSPTTTAGDDVGPAPKGTASDDEHTHTHAPGSRTNETADLEAAPTVSVSVPAPTPTPAPPPPHRGFAESSLEPWRFFLLSIGVGLGLFLSMLDTSIVATSLLAIGQDLGSFELINWVALAYTLAYLSCAVVFARLAEILGRRDAFLLAFVLFFGFSLGCGFATSLRQLIAMRALQGVGGSGLYSLSMIIWPEVAPPALRQHIASLAGIVIGVAGVLGPILGGLLTTYASWRWVFWINGPVGFASMAVFALTWPRKERLPYAPKHPWSSLDVVGALLLVAAAALVTFAFQNAGVNPDQWTHAVFLAPLLTGVAAWAALFAWERAVEVRWTHITPAFPLSLLRNRVYASAMLATLVQGFPFYAVVFSFPLRLQVVNGKTGLMAGVMMLPLLGGVSVGSIVCGAANARKNWLCATMLVASVLMVVGCALETTLSDAARLEPKAMGFLPLIGLGLGMLAAASTMLAAVHAPLGDFTAAQGIMAQARVLGGSIGIAASSAVLASHEQKALGTVVSLSAGAAELGGAAGTGDALVRTVFAAAFAEDMRVSAIVSGAGLLLALGTYQRHAPSIRASTEARMAEAASASATPKP